MQWWERSPPTSVSWVWFLDPASYVGCVYCWFLFCPEGFFSGYSGFPLSSKTNISKFQLDPRMHGHFWTSSCELLGAPCGNKLHTYINYIYFSITSWSTTLIHVWTAGVCRKSWMWVKFFPPTQVWNNATVKIHLSYRMSLNSQISLRKPRHEFSLLLPCAA